MGLTKLVDYSNEVKRHYEECWGIAGIEKKLLEGPMNKVKSEFHILVFAPNKARDMWTYATVGMSSFENKNPVELHIFSTREDDSLIELLTVVAYYHLTDQKVSLSHTVNFGRPWQDHSPCDHGFISLPFLDGPKLEDFRLAGKMIKFFWLIPVTKSEVEYKKNYGVDALEEKFEQHGLDYINPLRKAII